MNMLCKKRMVKNNVKFVSYERAYLGRHFCQLLNFHVKLREMSPAINTRRNVLLAMAQTRKEIPLL